VSPSSPPQCPARLRGPSGSGAGETVPRAIPELLERAARTSPEKGIAIRDRSGRLVERRRYADLPAAARAAAAKLAQAGVASGDRLLLCLPTSWHFFDCWLGALCLGAVPAAAAPPTGGSARFGERLGVFRSVVGAARFVVGERLAADLRAGCPDTLGAIALDAAALLGGPAASSRAPAGPTDPEALAYLQFTSGSTGRPRAVMVTHAMAIDNALAIGESIAAASGRSARDPEQLNNGWLPMHHDMGLVGCLVYSLARGIELSLMPPTAFLARPLAYLQAAHGQPSILSGPNFGFQFCADRLSRGDVEGLDLSRVEAAMTGSEMIRPKTMQAFCELVEPTGFVPEMLAPCYGMAEATLAVTLDTRRQGPRTAPAPRSCGHVLEDQEVVCVGAPVRGVEVRVADGEGQTLAANQLGEVQLKGPSVFPGYFGDEAATLEAFSDGWLRTGDLGFVLDGELYIAGRFKEILVVRGENLMPHEVEWLAEEGRGASQGGERVAAFSVALDQAGEQIVLVVETGQTDPGKLAALDRAIRSRVGRGLSLPVADLVMTRRGRIPRTTSGKLQRAKLKAAYLQGAVERIAY